MSKLAGKVIVITGASSGIGAAVAQDLAPQGVKLVLAARRVARLERLAEVCRGLGSEAVAAECDVGRREAVFSLVDLAVKSFGKLDLMVANAGYGFLAPIAEVTDSQFDEIMQVNVKGTLYCMQAAAQVMKPQGFGHIIVVSSGAARRGLPLFGVYSATKAAQLSLAEALRVELRGTGVQVSTVHPLTTATEFFEVASQRSKLRSTGLGHAMPVDKVSGHIVRLMKRPRPELWPVPGSRLLLAFCGVFPSLADWVMARTVGRRRR